MGNHCILHGVVLCNMLARGAAISVAASHLQGLWFDPEFRLLSVWSFYARSPYVLHRFLQVPHFPPTFPKHASELINCP